MLRYTTNLIFNLFNFVGCFSIDRLTSAACDELKLTIRNRFPTCLSGVDSAQSYSRCPVSYYSVWIRARDKCHVTENYLLALLVFSSWRLLILDFQASPTRTRRKLVFGLRIDFAVPFRRRQPSTPADDNVECFLHYAQIINRDFYIARRTFTWEKNKRVV